MMDACSYPDNIVNHNLDLILPAILDCGVDRVRLKIAIVDASGLVSTLAFLVRGALACKVNLQKI